ncbi:MauE/DoxX family redox-associated membrane protein [Corallococcus terminator]|uniref:MauE/DoxX family redox-associated membrane protein n=1 Tax=Corallococcus terminator TaxID=2316733 RepID=UPI001FC9354A|nr:MauE/DoxX family redox-associated membrane protein [Corallococcus terminator]
MKEDPSRNPEARSGLYGLSDASLGHLVLRCVLGVNIAVHGLTRVGNPAAFAEGLVTGFSQTWLPAWSVRGFGFVLPFVELLTGLAVLLGLRLRAALVVGGLTMAALTFGTGVQQKWEIAGLQLFYAFVYAWLLHHASAARFTLDGALGNRRP